LILTGSFPYLLSSSFQSTFIDKVRDNYGLFNNEWIVARGADPVNTPELFFYELVVFMEFQLRTIKFSGHWFEDTWFNALKTLKDYSDQLDKWANKCLLMVQYAWARYERYKEKAKRSYLYQSIFEAHPKLGQDYDKIYIPLRRLFDTIGYGDLDQYPQAENALVDIEAYFNKHPDSVKYKEARELLKQRLQKTF
jgi:hypothetical protein